MRHFVFKDKIEAKYKAGYRGDTPNRMNLLTKCSADCDIGLGAVYRVLNFTTAEAGKKKKGPNRAVILWFQKYFKLKGNEIFTNSN